MEKRVEGQVAQATEAIPLPADGWLTTSALRMHYLDYGGPRTLQEAPLVALHGLSSSAHWYDLALPRLRSHFRCVAPDQRGHGLTDQPSTGYDWQTVATDVVEAMDRLGIQQAPVLGHSWGATVALQVAARYPQRVSHLVMIEGGFFRGPGAPGITWEAFKQRLRPRDIYGARERYLEALRRDLASCWSPEVERIVMTMPRIDPDGTVWERLELANQEKVLWAMWSEPASLSYPRVSCPSLIVAAGSRPGADPEFAQRRQQAVEATVSSFPRARAVWIPNTMHDIGLDKPQELAHALLDFLTGR
jgi:pimeloyl-ACP methyl ester carboxylesterase